MVRSAAPQRHPPEAWPTCRVEELGDLLAAGGWTLVEFWAPDNLFCRLLAPVRLGLPVSHGARLRLVCCSLDNCDGSDAAFGAVAIPALVLFHGRRRIRRWLGMIDLSLLRHHLDRTLGVEPAVMVAAVL